MDVPESIRVGRQMTGAVNSVTIGTSAAVLIGADDKRVGLRLFSSSTNRISIGDSPQLTLDGGMNIPAGGTGFQLNITQDGQIVTKRLYAIAAGAGTVIGYLETRLEA